MKSSILQVIALTIDLWFAHSVVGEPIPSPTGQYNVGIRTHVIDFINRDDPASPPSNISTEYLATLYYPTLDPPSPPTPYLDPELAEIFHGLSLFNVSHLTSTLRWNASFLPSHQHTGPTLLFGPAFSGPPTVGYTILLSDLASRGYVVAALDHPGEQPFLRFPNGTTVYGINLDGDDDDTIAQFHEVRVREMLHFIDYWPSLVKKLGAPFKIHGLGAVGHSLGGSCALTMALESKQVVAAINLDGANVGRLNSSASAANIRKPTMLLAAEQHTNELDPSWANFEAWQKGWWRVFRVNDTVHYDWSDLTWWKQWGTNMTLGSIDGGKMVDLTRAYVDTFFDEFVWRGSILDGLSAKWPEVNYVDGHQH